MGILVYSLFWLMQDLHHQPYLGTWTRRVLHEPEHQTLNASRPSPNSTSKKDSSTEFNGAPLFSKLLGT